MKLYQVLLTFTSWLGGCRYDNDDILGGNHDAAHKAPTSLLRFDTQETLADATQLTCFYNPVGFTFAFF